MKPGTVDSKYMLSWVLYKVGFVGLIVRALSNCFAVIRVIV